MILMRNRKVYKLLILILYTMEEENLKKVKCSHCGYEWNTRSTHKYVSCPSCLGKVKNEKEANKNGKANKSK